MKESRSKTITHRILCALTIFPIAVTVCLLPFISSKVPVHYGALGNIDRWGSKYELLLYPIVIVPFGYFLRVMINLSYKRLKNTKVEKFLLILIIIISMAAIIFVDYDCLGFLYKSFSKGN